LAFQISAVVRVLSVNYSQLATIRPNTRCQKPDLIGMNWGELGALPGKITLLTGRPRDNKIAFLATDRSLLNERAKG